MGKVKSAESPTFYSAADWLRRVAGETSAFEIVKAADLKTKRAGHRKPDWNEVITISVRPNHARVDLFAQTRQHLLPNTVLGILQKLKGDRPNGAILLCAPYISTRVAQMCREQNVGYLDGAGNCWIAAPGLFVNVTGRPNRPTLIKTIDPFSKKSSRVVRTLLTYPKKGWQVQQLAQQSDVSLGLVSKVKTALIEEAYLEEQDRLLFLRDGIKLLQGWSAEYRPYAKRIQLFAIARPSEIEKSLAAWCRANHVTYALTQLAGAWRYSPMVRYDKSAVYVDRKCDTPNKLKSLLELLDAKEVDTGANCVLWITDDPAVFTGSTEFDGVKVVSALQLYLDLMALPGRGKDAAEEIFERELRPLLAVNERKSGGTP